MKIKKLISSVLAGTFFVAAILTIFTGCNRNKANVNQQSGWGNSHWIWNEDKVKYNDWVNFRRDFTLKDKLENVEIKIACDTKYWLYVNGTEVIFEGGLKRGDDTFTYYDTVEISDHLEVGKNSICIQVWYWGTKEKGTHYLTSGTAGLIVSTDLYDDQSKHIIETGDGNWWTQADYAYSRGSAGSNAYLGESSIVYDARKASEWTNENFNPKSNGWKKAVSVGRDKEDAGYAGDKPWGELKERSIPQWKDYGLKAIDVSDCAIENKNGITIYTIKLPYNMQFTPYLELGNSTIAGVTITAQTETYSLSGLNLQYTTTSGSQKYEGRGWINGDYLYFTVPDGVEVKSLGYHQRGYAVETGTNTPFLGYFDSTIIDDDISLESFTGGWSWNIDEVSGENNFYDELWKKGAYSLYVCMRDTYMDCPDRERGQYIGDALNEIEEAFYVLGPEANALSAKAIREICARQVEYSKGGKTYYAMSSLEPIVELHEIPIQELGTAVAAWKYYLFTGDHTVPQDCFTALYNYLTNYSYVKNGKYEGTIRMRTADELKSSYHLTTSQLSQWSDWGNNQDTRVAINCWWYMSAVAVRNLADIDGVNASQDQIAYLNENIEKVKNNFNKFWNSELNAYASDFGTEWNAPLEYADGSHLVDDRINALAVVAGLADTDKYDSIRNVFMGTENSPSYENASIYMEKYVLEALYIMGYDTDAMVRMKKRHKNAVNDKLSSTLPELWQSDDVADFSDYEGTKNHGWSSGSLIALSRYAAGIVPISAGYRAWRLMPQLGSFSSVSACVPSEIGLIKVDITKDNGEFYLSLTSPGGIAEVFIPMENDKTISVIGSAEYLREETVNGKMYAVYQISKKGDVEFSCK